MNGRSARMTGGFASFVLLASLPWNVAFAQADSDLDRISELPAAAQQTPSIDPNTQLYIQNDAEIDALRSGLVVPSPPPRPPRWEDRLFFDARIRRTLFHSVDLVISDRFNLRAEDGLGFPNHEDVRNDLREAYLAWTIDSSTFLNAGRVNLKSGVALGFNPTDFFKTRAVVEPLSADPSVLRDDRLGTLMLMGQKVWNGGSLTIAYAPKLYAPSAIYRNTTLPSFNPMFDRTNAANRALVKGSFNLFDDLSPELLAYFEDGRMELGANFTRGFGQSVIGYVEWAGGDSADLVTRALVYGRDTGTIPAAAPSPFSSSASRFFQSDVALGASYTTESKITFNFEYHFHQAGFSAADWRNWIKAGEKHIAPLDAELWYIRAYAADQQEPLAKHSLFVRADRQDAFIPNLELTSFVNLDFRDGSGLIQANADYYLSREWTVGVQASGTFGDKRTDFGSLPGAASLLLKVSRYF